MATKYLISKGTLERKDNSINFKNEKGNNYIPIENVDEIYCLNEVSFNTKLVDFLSKNGVTLHLFNHYEGYSGTFYPRDKYVSGKLTIEQVKAYETKREKISKAIVAGIAANIHEVLYHYYRHDCVELKPFWDYLKNDVEDELKSVQTVNEIMLVEAKIWNYFYEQFNYFLRNDFVMNKRVKRPPDNPINALISYGNTILYTKTISQIYQTHLNQTISFLHSAGESRFSLSLDLSEVFKPVIVYKTIFDCVNNRKLSVEKHFDKKLNYCLLNETGKKIFIAALEERFSQTYENKKLKRKVSLLTAIKYDAYKLIKEILEDVDFVPFSLKNKQ